jgi:putative addiction module CopG family antidote
MGYQFPPDIQERVQAQIASGVFQSEDEVLREAIETLEHRQRGLAELQAMVREADADVEAGRVGYFDVSQTMARVNARVVKQRE